MKFKDLLKYTILFLIAIGMIFPMMWMIILSLSENPVAFASFSDLFSGNFSFKNYSDALSSDSFNIYFLNSLIVALIVTAGNIVFCLMTGYALARRNSRFNKILMLSILGVLVIPPHVIMIPLYRLMVNFNWINTYAALTIPWLITPFGVFLVRQYIRSLPEEIENAARIDGASELRILFGIVMPLAKPVLVVLAIYTFLANWNSFLFPFLFTNEESMRTLPVGLAFYLGKQSIDWGHLMAGGAMSALPVIILFLFFQNQIIKGLTSGALKE